MAALVMLSLLEDALLERETYRRLKKASAAYENDLLSISYTRHGIRLGFDYAERVFPKLDELQIQTQAQLQMMAPAQTPILVLVLAPAGLQDDRLRKAMELLGSVRPRRVLLYEPTPLKSQSKAATSETKHQKASQSEAERGPASPALVALAQRCRRWPLVISASIAPSPAEVWVSVDSFFVTPLTLHYGRVRLRTRLTPGAEVVESVLGPTASSGLAWSIECFVTLDDLDDTPEGGVVGFIEPDPANSEGQVETAQHLRSILLNMHANHLAALVRLDDTHGGILRSSPTKDGLSLCFPVPLASLPGFAAETSLPAATRQGQGAEPSEKRSKRESVSDLEGRPGRASVLHVVDDVSLGNEVRSFLTDAEGMAGKISLVRRFERRGQRILQALRLYGWSKIAHQLHRQLQTLAQKRTMSGKASEALSSFLAQLVLFVSLSSNKPSSTPQP